MKARRGWVCLMALTALVSLVGCKVGPNYRRPSAPTPETYREASAGGAEWKIASPADEVQRGNWWSIYQDPLLDELAGKVAPDNQNLRAYAAAYAQALALAQEAQAALMPQLALSPQAARGRASRGPATGNSITATTRTVEATATWDLDIWGKFRRQLESDRAAAQASAAQLAAAQLSAQAELVSDYFQLRYEDSLRTLLTETTVAYRRSLEITRNQYDAGVAAQSDVITAETQLQTTQSQLVAVGVSRAQLEHAIALLIGKLPSQLTIPPAPLSTHVPDIPLVIPSLLLERRPDIAQAERTIAQQSALVGVAVAAWFPDVSLSGLLGYAATGGGSLITGSNRVWSGAVTGSQVLFDGGARSGALAAARAGYDQSVANYRQTVLNAFGEVETCLSSLRVLAEQAGAQHRAVSLSSRGVEIALHEYEAGVQSYTAVANAQATALASEEIELQIASSRLLQSVALLKALGGGWSAR